MTPDPQASNASNHADEIENPPRGVHAMAIFRWILIAIMAVVAALSVAYSFGLVSGGAASAAATVYHCPMHPQIVQDHPGECPICGMTLVKREGSDNETIPAPAPSAARPAASDTSPPSPSPSSPSPPSTSPSAPRGVPGLVPVQLALDRVQTIGVRTARATQQELHSLLKTVGLVAADETKFARVHARFSGWIERLAVAETGRKVSRGQVLADIYNLELLPAQQEFLAARRWGLGAGGAAPTDNPRALGASLERDARTRLELFGLSPAEIERIAETGTPARTLAVTSPIAGHVTRKNAVQGSYVQPGTELFEIADLSKVWVLADIYEHEWPRVHVGQDATVTLIAYPGERFAGKVTFLYPTLDPMARTLRARIELDNERLALRPGMYGDVLISVEAAPGVVIPSEALVDTGDYQYVFVAQEGGRFEPRLVRPGARSDGRVQILEGLAPDELVVTTANFLIDSESRLRAAVEGAPAEANQEPAP